MSAFTAERRRPTSLSLVRDGKPCNVVLMGPPASGKGTQSEFLRERYGMVHLSTGDILRARQNIMPELSQYINSGRLVPDDLVSSVLKERLADRDCAESGVLLDGFPRTRAQAESLVSVGVEVSDVIHLCVDDEVVVERISGRRIDPLSGKIYHVKHQPPPPEIASRVIQRQDDTEEKVRRRLRSYHAERDALVAFYGDKVSTISVGNSPTALPPDVRPIIVFDEVRKALERETYWGSVVRSDLVAKAFECGTYATTMFTVARYFEHSRYRLLHNGCLADAMSQAHHVALRAQVVQLAERLEPLTRYLMRAWLEHVGRHAVVVGHAISKPLEDGSVVDVARGSAALVFLGLDRESMEIPGAPRLRELVAPAIALGDHVPVNDVRAARPEAMAEILGPAPLNCWRTLLYPSAGDFDFDDTFHQAAAISLMERVRVQAAAEGGYPMAIAGQLRHARTLRAYVAYLGYAAQGDVFEGWSWCFTPAKSGRASIDTPVGVHHLAFEFHEKITNSLMLRGCLVMEPMGPDAGPRL